MKEYSVKFIKSDGTEETRTFSLVNTSTNRARSVLKKFVKLENNGATLNEDFLEILMGDEEQINNLMKQILVGNHEGVNWQDAEWKTTDEVVASFFTSFQ